MRDPRNGGTTESDDRKDSSFASAPPGAYPEENQRQIDSPCDERSRDQTVVDPARAVRNVSPDDDNDDADGNEDKPRAERSGNQFVQHPEWRKQPIEGTRLLAFELAFLHKVRRGR